MSFSIILVNRSLLSSDRLKDLFWAILECKWLAWILSQRHSIRPTGVPAEKNGELPCVYAVLLDLLPLGSAFAVCGVRSIDLVCLLLEMAICCCASPLCIQHLS